MNDYHSNVTSYVYASDGLLSTITAPGSKTWSFSRDGYDRLTKVDLPNGMHTEYAFDAEGRRTSITHKDGATVEQGFDYEFATGGNITKITHEDGAYWAYEYDDRDRLTQAERYDATPALLHRFTYTYDDAGNMLTKEVYDAGASTTDTTTFGYNNANEQTSLVNGGTTVTQEYDAWGRLTSRDDGTYSATYSYRYGSKLYSVTSDFPAEGDVTYETGGDHKRRSRVADVSETWYNYTAGFDVLSTEDDADGSSGVLTRTYIGRTTAQVDGAVPSASNGKYFLLDRVGSTRQIRNEDKSQYGSLEYEPYGEVYVSTGAVNGITLRYTGLLRDFSVRAYYAVFRWYSSESCRWIARDPQGMVDGPNLYAYVGGEPISRQDPLGLSWAPVDIDYWLPGKLTIDPNCSNMAGYTYVPERGNPAPVPIPTGGGGTIYVDAVCGPTGCIKIPGTTKCRITCSSSGKPHCISCRISILNWIRGEEPEPLKKNIPMPRSKPYCAQCRIGGN